RPSSGVSVILFPLSRYGLAYHLLCEVPVLVNLVLTQVLQGRRQPTHDFNQGPEFGHRDRVFHFLRREVRNSTMAQVHQSAVHFHCEQQQIVYSIARPEREHASARHRDEPACVGKNEASVTLKSHQSANRSMTFIGDLQELAGGDFRIGPWSWRGMLHAATLSSLSAPRATILRASSGNGRCSVFASSHGARIQTSCSS